MSFTEQEEKERKEVCCNCKHFRLCLIGSMALCSGKCGLLSMAVGEHHWCQHWEPAATDGAVSGEVEG